ncbi:hypothetical protein ACFTXM_40265 [Streptomyces sp. NPDC056930]|uniref:hypothetical protein n=1 Tax=Streptomyces sp. NPDC056930 TaxID=3345967 RepID=UPI00363004B1
MTFAEQVPGLTVRYQWRTPQLQGLVEAVGVVLAGRGGARMLRILNVTLSRCTVLSQLMRVPLPLLDTPRVLGVDDFALYGGTYGTLLVDATTRLPLTLWEGRDAEQLSRWLREHSGGEDKEFTGYKQNANGTVTAFFTDGTTATGDLPVGADGARSRVRRQLLSHSEQHHTLGVGIGGKLPLGHETAWLPQEMTGTKNMVLPKRDSLFTAVFHSREGSATVVERIGAPLRAVGLGTELVIQDTKDDHYIMRAYVAHPHALPADATGQHGRQLRDLVASRLAGRHPDLRELIAQTLPDTIGSSTSQPQRG